MIICRGAFTVGLFCSAAAEPSALSFTFQNEKKLTNCLNCKLLMICLKLILTSSIEALFWAPTKVNSESCRTQGPEIRSKLICNCRYRFRQKGRWGRIPRSDKPFIRSCRCTAVTGPRPPGAPQTRGPTVRPSASSSRAAAPPALSQVARGRRARSQIQ